MTKDDETIAAHLIISGRVQGVCFRATTQEVAREHGLAGWVKNRFDGKVEALLEGSRREVEKVILWCRSGPPSAHVSGVEIAYLSPTGEFDTFSVRY